MKLVANLVIGFTAMIFSCNMKCPFVFLIFNFKELKVKWIPIRDLKNDKENDKMLKEVKGEEHKG